MFFFEKKNQKTFAPLRASVATSPGPIRRVGYAKRNPPMVSATTTSQILLGFWIALFGVTLSAQPPAIAGKPDAHLPIKVVMQDLLTRFVKSNKSFSAFIANEPGFLLAANTEIFDLSKLPAPPAAPSLSAPETIGDWLESLGAPGAGYESPPHMIWLPQGDIGALYAIEGPGSAPGDCPAYIFFKSDGKDTIAIDPPPIYATNECASAVDTNYNVLDQSFIIKRDQDIYALNYQCIEPVPPSHTNFKYSLSWARWTKIGWQQAGSVSINSGEGTFNIQ